MGILSALLSTFFATSKDLVSKGLASKVDSTTSAFASFFFALPFYLILLLILWLCGVETFATKEGFLLFIILRASTDTVAEWSKMAALSYGDLSLVTMMLSLHPLILAFISPLITGDQLPLAGLIAVTVVVSGSLLSVLHGANFEKKDGANTRKATALAFLASLCFALNNCFDRMAMQTASAPLTGFVMTLLACTFIFPAFIRLKSSGPRQLLTNFKLFSLRGLFEILFMICKLSAIKVMQAPYVAAIGRFSMILSILAGRYIFNEKDFRRRLLAGALIFMGVCWVILLNAR